MTFGRRLPIPAQVSLPVGQAYKQGLVIYLRINSVIPRPVAFLIHKADWAITYIIDSRFDIFLERNIYHFPTRFRSAIKSKQVREYPIRLV
jgi:hypothetical protein